MSRLSVLLATLLAMCGCAPAATNGEVPSAGAPKAKAVEASTPPASGSMRLTIRLAPSGPEVISRVVSQSLVNRRDPHAGSETFYRAYDSAGRLVAERGFVLETERHVDVPAEDGSLSGARAKVDSPIASLHIPLVTEISVVRLYRRGVGSQSSNEPELLAEVRP